jgi:hypothetical protein
MSQKRLPCKARPEPQTADEIRADIEFWEEQLNGQLDEAIEDRIWRLKDRLREMTDVRET